MLIGRIETGSGITENGHLQCYKNVHDNPDHPDHSNFTAYEETKAAWCNRNKADLLRKKLVSLESEEEKASLLTEAMRFEANYFRHLARAKNKRNLIS